MNFIRAWLYLIGTPERAEYVLANFWKLEGKRHISCGGEVRGRACQKCGLRVPLQRIRTESPLPGPERLLFSSPEVADLYVHPDLRAALDAWDAQLVDLEDMRRIVAWVRDRKYTGPAASLYVPKIADAA